MVWITLGCEFDENERQWVRRYAKMPSFQMQAAEETSFLGYTSLLNVESLPNKTIRSTSIACYIDNHRNNDILFLQKMMENGMNIARLDTTNAYRNHSLVIENIRQAAKNYSECLGEYFPIGIGIDTLGPTIRTGFMEGGEYNEVELVTGAFVKLTSDPAYMHKCSAHVIYVGIENICESIAPIQVIFIDEGMIKLVCLSIAGVFITCKVEAGGVLGSQKIVSLPNQNFDWPAISKFDKNILKFAVKHKIDFIFCAFVSNASSVIEIRNILGEKGKNIKLISKVETREGIKNLPDIIKASDGILIGRGDLCLHVTLQKLFIAQKYITAMCNKAGCPVIVSRQLMESMRYRPLPTRAEVSDVANAVEDGADILMLPMEMTFSNQTNTVLKIVSQICKEAEAALWRFPHNEWAYNTNKETDVGNSLAETVVNASIAVCAAAIFAITENGQTAQLLSKYRPRCPIIAITRNIRVVGQCHLYRSIIPFFCEAPEIADSYKDIDVQVEAALRFGRKRDFIHPNDPIIVFIGNTKNNKYENSMRIIYAEEHLEIKNNVLHIN